MLGASESQMPASPTCSTARSSTIPQKSFSIESIVKVLCLKRQQSLLRPQSLEATKSIDVKSVHCHFGLRHSVTSDTSADCRHYLNEPYAFFCFQCNQGTRSADLTR